ncbi:MAG: hypothetical protein IJ700_04350 [Bacteroidaceae bacterium]|nr:hypothetical protein [Bacteroidaceae bacterium]
MDRITITNPPIVSSHVLETIASQQNLTKPKARTWLKHHIFDVVKSSFMYIDGIPHTYKNSDYKFVTAALLSTGVSVEEADMFFNANFKYSEQVSSSGKIEFAETVMDFSKRFAKQTMKESPELAEILRNNV